MHSWATYKILEKGAQGSVHKYKAEDVQGRIKESLVLGNTPIRISSEPSIVTRKK